MTAQHRGRTRRACGARRLYAEHRPRADACAQRGDDESPTFWHGIWVPKGTAPAIIRKLNAAIVEALADPAVQFRDVGQEVWPADGQNPAALAAKQEEFARWAPIIRQAGIKVQ
ncbi:MAG TPA: tripartite tricarboxylate transporter substrate-binding protein [Xanthobacteraceae bacterium]|nr:tripartite tricarboxylate transporter substrate-binding protein [Xanthobacteraceae bacterium]